MADTARCLMQEVARRAGEPDGDRPRVTHPVLALLAQQVHDRTSPAGRAALFAQVPDLTGARSDDPRVGRELVRTCAARALAADPPPRVRRVAARLHRRADRRAGLLAQGLGTAGLAAPLRAAGPAIAVASLADLAVALRCVLAVAGPAGGQERDRVLADLLVAAIAAVRVLGSPEHAAAPTRGRSLTPA